MERVCDPVRSYLRIREDTVRCIVASLTDDSSNELADVSLWLLVCIMYLVHHHNHLDDKAAGIIARVKY